MDLRKAAIVTGASSGIGLAICRTLCTLECEGHKGNMGDKAECENTYPSEHTCQYEYEYGYEYEYEYEVFGFGRDFSDATELLSFPNFHAIEGDLLETGKLSERIRAIQKEYEVHVLVNNAGIGFYGLHEELNPRKIQRLVRTNLELPMILSNLLLRNLKKTFGYIINISSVTASLVNPHGCAYGATKAGLSSFSHSLYEEARKYGVKVVNIQPDMTKTNLYRDANFEQGEEVESYLLPEEIANAVKFVLEQREGVVVTDLTLRPQLHRIKRKP